MTSAALAVTIAHAAQPRSGSCRSRSCSSTRRSSTSSSGPRASRSPPGSSSRSSPRRWCRACMRSTEIRIEGVDYDDVALGFIREAARTAIDAHHREPAEHRVDHEEYAAQVQRCAALASPAPGRRRCSSWRFGRATRRTSRTCCTCRASTVGGFRILRCASPAIPNAIAGLLLDLRDRTVQHPARVLRLDRRQPGHVPAEVPRLRRRRHRAGLPRSPATGRARSCSATTNTRWVRLNPPTLRSAAPSASRSPRPQAPSHV